ncbi:hypothetical protein [Paenibacillus sp. HJGM_3]|uniref:hypothetical protein n=1 Tax=Paenibacillus sp. HJGM_3 TaxID=3379816 RepID=UPI00386B5F27
MPGANGNTKKSFPLRMDPKLYEIIEHWAADELRSVNGHIEYLLRAAAFRSGRLRGPRPAGIPATETQAEPRAHNDGTSGE